jgi:DNA-binding NtrC family response regulator
MSTDTDLTLAREPVVLCIDDDSRVLASLRRLLRGEPYGLVTATNAAQAFASLRVRPVEVVVSDERMPDVTGCELLAEVRQRWPWIGRVILTAHADPTMKVRAFEAGVDFLFHKPWNDDALKTTIRRLIREVERERAAFGDSRSAEPQFDLGGEGG